MTPFMSGLSPYPVDPEDDEDDDEEDGYPYGLDPALAARLGLDSGAADDDDDAAPQTGLLAEPKHGVGHPGTLESFIPVWGSGREAVADWQDGNYLGAGLNAALAVSDVFGAGFLLKALGKEGLKWLLKAEAKRLAKGDLSKLKEAWQVERNYSRTWNATRKRLQKAGHIRKGEQGHHWLIPQNGWGKRVPEWVKNRAWNIKSLPVVEHQRIHHGWKGAPRFDIARQYWYGTPAWAKADNLSALGHPVSAYFIEDEEDGGR